MSTTFIGSGLAGAALAEGAGGGTKVASASGRGALGAGLEHEASTAGKSALAKWRSRSRFTRSY
jgi:hypothetical protein